MSARRPVALLLTPVLPMPGGSGRALRSWGWLRTLARDYRVHVLLAATGPHTAIQPDYPAEAVWPLPVGAAPRLHRAAGLLCPPLALVSRRFVVDWQHASHPDALADVLTALAGEPVARILVFRLPLHEVALAASRAFPDAVTELDLDDLESRTRLSVAGASLRMRRWREGLRGISAAIQYGLVERFARGGYRTLYLAAEEDCRRMSTRLADAVAWHPNRVHAPPDLPPVSDERELRLLFVGTLDYPPNEEAVLDLVNRLMPELRRLPRPTRLCIAGSHAPPALKRLLEGNPGVDFAGDADDLAGLYAAAHAVLVPLRAGGGTKLKTLEAFAHRRPVVSPRHGVRGLGAVAGEHYLAAETPAEFAQAIERLARDRALAERLAEAGRRLCERAFRAA